MSDSASKTQENSSAEAMERVKLARHPERPYTLDFIQKLFTEFVELRGDRHFADDPALICGFGRFHEMHVAILGHQKGRDTKQRRFRNFGMPKPEGYRKALRIMRLAEKYNRPLITFIDTPGAYPGIDAEERGQAEAIARNLFALSRLRIPIIVAIVGEGGSGGALAIGIGDQILMMENSIYSVITPEGCAAILWKDAGQAPLAAAALRLTANDLLQLKIIDKIVAEPESGAHASHEEAASLLDESIYASLTQSLSLPLEERLARRYDKLRMLGF